MIRRPPRSTLSSSSAASDVYKRQVLNHADLYHQNLARLCASLRDQLVHVYANMYLTPPRSQAVGTHTDDQDVIILQIAGTKLWTLYESPVTLPYTHEMVGKTGPHRAVTDQMREKVVEEVELQAGDLLYLPRGMMHEARTGDGNLSLHLTLTCPSHDFTWAKFGANAIGQLLMQQEGELRHMVKPETALGSGEASEQEAAILAQIVEAVKGLSLSKAQEAFRSKMGSHNGPQDHAAHNEQMSAPLPRQIRPSSQLRMRRGMLMGFDDGDRTNPLCKLVIKNNGRTLEQAVDRQHIFIYHAIASTKGDHFAVEELPGDGYSQICVCKLLLRQEVLEIFEQGASGGGKGKAAIMSSIPEDAHAEEDDDGELLYSG
eukprot:TRINITY_DN2807_c0_g1_i2.p1 TRINITY_DN2807_c0_g1~~TRINITY_DN2807_c0_g1_i2.p1  ORF type:complete len:374 (+),score=100.53 TRINITY_DN2807_c0_g1_i2:107-1228(+)